jgi:SAM-dependent methyltransferase
MMAEKAYVLGTHDVEIERLGQQHHLWSEIAYGTWDRASIKGGSRVLEIGCGPGFTTLDIAGLATPTGRVLALDQSERFITHLMSKARLLNMPQIEGRVADVQRIPDLGEQFDAAYTRWVLCFIPDPEAAVASVAKALRPGGLFAMQEFHHYLGIALAPHSPPFRRACEAVEASFRAGGGDPSIGMRLPTLLEKHGLHVQSIRPISRIARPSDPLWQWPTVFYAQQLPRLVEAGFLTAQELAAFTADWAAKSADPGAYYMTPPMLEIVARKG